ncbi:hypothetical protein ACJIZ3_016953 [Penstemon smallii]|uniref:Uncharacterized protein n=1 Tax=Penstemon smallii TaxID=265156 RepID=A0ABD3SUT7_9LAMI
MVFSEFYTLREDEILESLWQFLPDKMEKKVIMMFLDQILVGLWSPDLHSFICVIILLNVNDFRVRCIDKNFVKSLGFKIMGRGRTKGKKVSVTNKDDVGSGEEEKIPAQKRRGRPQKPLKDEIDEDEAQKLEEDEDSEDTSGLADNKDTKSSKNGKKRKRNAQVKDKASPDSVKEENGNVHGNGIGNRSSTEEESNKSNGSFRQNGNGRSRRKNKPRRAAEAVVECN